tara:strand:- start:1615 stop:1986 length:372 start_codon:yes stop_codon:yes gene_type:complete
MKIKTLENGDRQLELSEYERVTLIEVVTYLRDHYGDLEFSIRNFTLDEANEILSLLSTLLDNEITVITLDKVELFHKVTREADNLIISSILDEKDGWQKVLDDLYDMLFDNLGVSQFLQENHS